MMMTGNYCSLEYLVLTLRALVSAAAMMLMLKTMQVDQVNATSLAPVIWNATNPIFKSSKNDHVIEVKLFDDIDFVCPYYDLRHTTTTAADENQSDPYEYLTVFMVNRREYEDCIIHRDSTATAILNCSNPHQRKRFTILFEPFQSIPNAREYHPGSSYYFITTSTGKWDGLDNLVHGSCLQRNMKLTIRVCCQNIVAKGNASQSSSISKTSYTSFNVKKTTLKDDDHDSLPVDTDKRLRQTSIYTSHTTSDPNRLKTNHADHKANQQSHLHGTVIQVIDRRHEWIDGGSSNEIDLPPTDEREAKHERLLSSGDVISRAIFHAICSHLCFVICLTTSLRCWHS